MTLQATISGASALANLSFGPNEIASCLVIAKSVGSLFSRDENASLFRVFEDQFGVRVTRLPSWLDDVTFRRSPRLMRQNMRSQGGLQSMENVRMHSLEGVATFLVFITRNVLPKAQIVTLIETLLLDGLGPAVTAGELETLPYNLKPLLRSFVEATLDCDADCRQSTTALEWMAELCAMVGATPKDFLRQENIPIRLKNTTLYFVNELFGAPSLEEERNKVSQISPHHPSDAINPKVKVFDALSLHVAYMALAARANGADVVVNVMLDGSVHQVPQVGSTSSDTFHVRLWLCQPPAEVLRIFRRFQQPNASGGEPNDHILDSSTDEDESDITIFGGEAEISIWTARTASYKAAHLPEYDLAHTVRELWSAGQVLASRFSWKMADSTSFKRPMRFRFQDGRLSRDPIQPVITDLVKLFQQRNKAFKVLAQSAATAVHKLYQYDSYCEDALGESARSELVGAMKVVVTSFAVASMEQITNVFRSTDGGGSYAVSRRTLTSDGGALSEAVGRALTSDGVAFHRLLWAAATLWGGANLKSQGSAMVSDGVMGIVAPQCTVIIDIIRDPLGFVKQSTSAKLLSVLHGAIPMLPRDPETGFLRAESGSRRRAVNGHNQDPERYFEETFRRCLSTDTAQNAHRLPNCLSKALSAETEESRSGDSGRSREVVITFEPAATDPTLGIFCAWHMGNLVSEIDPVIVFLNIMKRTPENLKTIKYNEGDLHDWDEAFVGDHFSGRFIPMSRTKVLETGHFKVDKGCVVVRGGGQCGWLVLISGLAHSQAVFVRDALTEAQMQDIESKLVDGDVIIMFD